LQSERHLLLTEDEITAKKLANWSLVVTTIQKAQRRVAMGKAKSRTGKAAIKKVFDEKDFKGRRKNIWKNDPSTSL
jgi:hypothetical protein